jgi:hypothetical protein
MTNYQKNEWLTFFSLSKRKQELSHDYYLKVVDDFLENSMLFEKSLTRDNNGNEIEGIKFRYGR